MEIAKLSVRSRCQRESHFWFTVGDPNFRRGERNRAELIRIFCLAFSTHWTPNSAGKCLNPPKFSAETAILGTGLTHIRSSYESFMNQRLT